jgi:hypothetical protein
MCIVSTEYLESFLEHVRHADTITEIHRTKVVIGIITHLTELNCNRCERGTWIEMMRAGKL